MKPSTRNQLAHLDRTLLALLQERARLLSGEDSESSDRLACIDDLLQRAEGPFDPGLLKEVFDAVDRGCGGSSS